MAHRTKIGGTAYEIKGGKTKVGGTGYSISKGRTKVGGTGYDVAFAQPTFTLSFPASLGAPTLTFSFEEGMTWQQFVLSDYNWEYSVASAACEWAVMFVIDEGDLYCYPAHDVPPYGTGLKIDSNGMIIGMDFGAGANSFYGGYFAWNQGGTLRVGLSDKITIGGAYLCQY